LIDCLSVAVAFFGDLPRASLSIVESGFEVGLLGRSLSGRFGNRLCCCFFGRIGTQQASWMN
jgi:hypothetical protein